MINPVEQNLLAHLLPLKQKVAIIRNPGFPILYLRKVLHLRILYWRLKMTKKIMLIVYWDKRRLWYVINCRGMLISSIMSHSLSLWTEQNTTCYALYLCVVIYQYKNHCVTNRLHFIIALK